MIPHRNTRAEEIILLANEFRRNARDTDLPFYIELLTRVAVDLEALAVLPAEDGGRPETLSSADQEDLFDNKNYRERPSSDINHHLATVKRKNIKGLIGNKIKILPE